MIANFIIQQKGKIAYCFVLFRIGKTSGMRVTLRWEVGSTTGECEVAIKIIIFGKRFHQRDMYL